MVGKGTGLFLELLPCYTEKALKCLPFFKTTKKPVSAADAKVKPSADSTGMHLKAEHVQVLPVHNQPGCRSGPQETSH